MDLLWLLTGASLFSAIVFAILWIQNQKKYYAALQELQDTTERLYQEHEEEVKRHQQMLTDLKVEHEEKVNDHERNVTKLKWEHDEEVKKLQLINTTYAPLINSDKEIEKRYDEINRLKDKLLQLNEKYQIAHRVYDDLEKQIELYKDTLDLSEYGLYTPQYSFDIPEQYKVELEGVYQKQKDALAKGTAIVCEIEWTVQGSVVEGRKMTKSNMKMMLFAFNGECDAVIAKVKWNNAAKSIDRIKKSFESINKLGEANRIRITNEYLNLKLQELFLTHEFEQKKYEEKEEQRRIREMMREEEKAQKEYERAQKEAEDEERRYQKALDKAKQELQGASQADLQELQAKVASLEKNLHEAAARKERAISLAQTTKVGHIYVISNIGSFGEDVYKIGMTRRIDPLDRVKELGDASVPFQFDVHAIIYSENAPQLEYELHKQFHHRRLNRINGRKEFFKVTLDDIETFIKEKSNAEIQFTKLAEAREYRETIAILEKLNAATSTAQEEEVFPESLLDQL